MVWWAQVLVTVLGLVGAGAVGTLFTHIRGSHHGSVVSVVDKRLDDKLAPINLAIKEVAVQVGEMRLQFGPNGGGMRQAINELQDDMTLVRVEVAGIRGELNVWKEAGRR